MKICSKRDQNRQISLSPASDLLFNRSKYFLFLRLPRQTEAIKVWRLLARFRVVRSAERKWRSQHCWVSSPWHISNNRKRIDTKLRFQRLSKWVLAVAVQQGFGQARSWSHEPSHLHLQAKTDASVPQNGSNQSCAEIERVFSHLHESIGFDSQLEIATSCQT